MEAPQKRNYHINLLVFSDYDQSDSARTHIVSISAMYSSIIVIKYPFSRTKCSWSTCHP